MSDEEEYTGPPFAGETSIPRDIDLSSLDGILDNVPKRYHGSNGLVYRGDPDAPTGPLTPGQVTCRVCKLDNRTRAASSPYDGLCDVCRADTPSRIARERRAHLENAVRVFTGERDLGDRETMEASAELDLARERAEVLMKLADMVAGDPVPGNLVAKLQIALRQHDDLQEELDEARAGLLKNPWVIEIPTEPSTHHLGPCLRPGQTIRLWDVSDRQVEGQIHHGVDGPMSWPLRLVVEHGELRLRTDQKSMPTAFENLATATKDRAVVATTLAKVAKDAITAAAAAQGVDLHEETAGYDRHTGEWIGPGPRPVPHTHNPETGEPLNFTERPEDTVRRFAGQNLELQAEIETLRRLVESGHELIKDEWNGVDADSDGGRWLATYAEWKMADYA